MKTHVSRDTTSSSHSADSEHRQASAGAAATQLQMSQRMVAQRQSVAAAFGGAAQLETKLEEEVQMKTLQRASPEEEMPLQGRSATAQLEGALKDEEPLQGRFATVQAKVVPNQTGMPDALKAGIESLSGMDMSSVRVHANSDKPAQLNALAYAQGNDIHLAPGQEQHLPHEAWHVVQQRQGRVQVTTQVQGVGINDDHGLESEADVMGARALSAGPAAQRVVKGMSPDRSSSGSSQPVQRMLYWYQGETRFTKADEITWNALTVVADNLNVGGALIAQVEEDIYDSTTGVTLAASIPTLSAAIRAGIQARRIDRNDADQLGWGQFATTLQAMAALYGQLTGPVSTGGHAAHTYTYVTSGGSQSIAEERNAHGQTSSNLNTRRGQMKVAIDLYNAEVNAHAAQY